MKPSYPSAIKLMPRKRKGHLFGLFDEQAVSILAVLMHKRAKFGELVEQTGLSKASLSRALKGLEGAAIVKKTAQGYTETSGGRQIIEFVLRIAEEGSKKTMRAVERRLSEMERDYRADHRIFHSDPKWERTAEKALIEVMAMRRMTGVESLLFQQKFQEEVAREEQKLRHSQTSR